MHVYLYFTTDDLKWPVCLHLQHQTTDQSLARITYGGSVPVGVVYTGIMALVDPLPEDGAGDGLVGQQQTYHLHVINNHQSIR